MQRQWSCKILVWKTFGHPGAALGCQLSLVKGWKSGRRNLFRLEPIQRGYRIFQPEQTRLYGQLPGGRFIPAFGNTKKWRRPSHGRNRRLRVRKVRVGHRPRRTKNWTLGTAQIRHLSFSNEGPSFRWTAPRSFPVHLSFSPSLLPYLTLHRKLF